MPKPFTESERQEFLAGKHIAVLSVAADDGRNVFSNADGTPSQLFFSHIAGLQKYMPAAMGLFCANVNS